MIKRWAIYLWESYNPLRWILFSCLVGLGVHSILSLVGKTGIPLNWYQALLVVANIFLFFLYVRVEDEFSDFEIDQEFFSDRPVPSGKITLKDLSALRWVVIALLFALNLVWFRNILEFAITFAVFFLSVKDFFTPKLLSRNRILSLLSHSPMYFILMIFIIALYTDPPVNDLFTKQNMLISSWFLTPLLIYEIARKTRSPEEDKDGYQSYSNLLGFRIAVIVLMFFTILYLWTSVSWPLTKVIVILFSTATAIFLGVCTYFVIFIPPKNTVMQRVGLVYLYTAYSLINIDRLM